MEILNGLENPIGEDGDIEGADSYDEAVRKYSQWAEAQPCMFSQPNRRLSENLSWFSVNWNSDWSALVS